MNGHCFAIQSSFCNYIYGEERASCFTFLSSWCLSVAIPHSDVDWSAVVCECVISLSYSLALLYPSKTKHKTKEVYLGFGFENQNYNTNYRLMQVKSIAEYSAIRSPFIKLPFVFKTFVLSIFKWPLKAGFTVI